MFIFDSQGPLQRADIPTILWLERHLTRKHVLSFVCSATTPGGDGVIIGRRIGAEVNSVIEYWDNLGIKRWGCLADGQESWFGDERGYEEPLHKGVSVTPLRNSTEQNSHSFSANLFNFSGKISP
jgi:hypothetical protein